MQPNQAITLLREVVVDLTSPNRDLKLILRKCLHACEILGWEPQKTWFHQELNGYYAGSTIPSYRIIKGNTEWRPTHTHDVSKWMAVTVGSGLPEEALRKEVTEITIHDGIDFIVNKSKSGHMEHTEDELDVYLRSFSKTIKLHKVRFFPQVNFQTTLSNIENRVFDFASRAIVQLQYSDSLGDLWADVRTQVDSKLQQLGFQDHLNAIREGIASANPETRRASIFACRNLMNDVANYLWQDSRKTYDKLEGQEGKLRVTEAEPKNRLAAYIHQKGITGKEGTQLRGEQDRLYESISSLIDQQSKAHGSISREEANYIALKTFILIGELVSKTDMLPILEYT